MTFKGAAAFVMPIGKYRTKTLDKIAETDDGLMYLDWLHGARQGDGRNVGAEQPVDEALRAYLSDDAIRRDLDKLLEGKT